MLSNYYYHEIIKKTIAAFGTLFNQIYIKHEDGTTGKDISTIRVPIAYGPIQKFLARIVEKPDLRNRVAITLPRMSFELTSIQYDSSRKTSSMQTFNAIRANNAPVKMFMPVPYNLGIQLSIITKYNDDMLQIIEQILPLFQPNFNLTVDLVSSIGEKRDIPIILENIQMQDDYEGNFDTRRSLIYTLNFTAKTYLFGKVADSPEGLIKKVIVDYHSDTNTRNSSRQLRYVATPKALNDYNNDATGSLINDITETDNKIEVSNYSGFNVDDRIIIDDEIMKVKSINGSFLTVERGYDNTSTSVHAQNSTIDIISESDDDLIPLGDSFDFNEEFFDFGDGKVYSTTKGIDVEL
jgi:hypothetical protein